MWQKCWTALTYSSKARETNMWHVFPHKNIWGETSTACGTSAKARLHSSPRYPKSFSWETSGPIPSWKVSGSAGNVEGGVWRAIPWATYMSTLKKSIFSRTPSLPTLTKPCLVISLSYRTVMFWKTHLSPTVSLNSMLCIQYWEKTEY